MDDSTPPPPGPTPPQAFQTNPQQTTVILGELAKMELRQEKRSDRLEVKLDRTVEKVAMVDQRSRNNEEEIDKGQAVQAIHQKQFNDFREVLAANTGQASGVRGWINTRALGIGAGAAGGGSLLYLAVYTMGQYFGWW